MLEKDLNNEKAFFRRGSSYLGIGELNKAKKDLMKAYELSDGKDANVINALK